ncbi:MAG: urea ABC transporter permease subunit UrtB [Alphaproteobacteria bacterium]|nr:urea ABC transporter permease subunit UrtB [Alphaproteobacteria bacterium]
MRAVWRAAARGRGGVAAALLALLLALPGIARAETDPFADIASTTASVEARGVTALAMSGHPRAATVIDALRDGKLYGWKWAQPDQPLFIRTEAGFVDARSGEAVAAPAASNLRKIVVSDTVRAAIETAEGALGLFADDAAKRRAAAEALFAAADPGSLSLIEKALAAERDPAVARVLHQAHAATLLKSEPEAVSERVAAVHELAKRGDLASRSLLQSLQDEPAPVAEAAAQAIAAIDRNIALWGLAQNAYYGVSLGAVLLLAAAGLAITFGVMGVINMAHGEMVMIGAYTTFVVQRAIAAGVPALDPYGLLIALPAAFLAAGIVGVLIEQTLIRFLYGRPLETLLATWGLSLVLQQAVRSVFGPTNQDVSSPAWMSGLVRLGGLTLTVNRLWIMLFAALVLGALMAALRWGGLGRSIRAVTQNRRMAAAMGIRTPLIDALTFGLGSGIAGMAGVALSQIDNVSPNLGQNYIIDSFIVVVVGGVGNLWGTLLGALTLGVVDKFIEPFAGAVLAKIMVLGFLILFIQRRPRGLFPVKGRMAEA